MQRKTKQPKTKQKEETRERFKEYKCTYPGCTEGLKTKYNCVKWL